MHLIYNFLIYPNRVDHLVESIQRKSNQKKQNSQIHPDLVEQLSRQ